MDSRDSVPVAAEEDLTIFSLTEPEKTDVPDDAEYDSFEDLDATGEGE